jgi:hypothetical protein
MLYAERIEEYVRLHGAEHDLPPALLFGAGAQRRGAELYAALLRAGAGAYSLDSGAQCCTIDSRRQAALLHVDGREGARIHELKLLCEASMTRVFWIVTARRLAALPAGFRSLCVEFCCRDRGSEDGATALISAFRPPLSTAASSLGQLPEQLEAMTVSHLSAPVTPITKRSVGRPKASSDIVTEARAAYARYDADGDLSACVARLRSAVNAGLASARPLAHITRNVCVSLVERLGGTVGGAHEAARIAAELDVAVASCAKQLMYGILYERALVSAL